MQWKTIEIWTLEFQKCYLQTDEIVPILHPSWRRLPLESQSDKEAVETNIRVENAQFPYIVKYAPINLMY